MIVLEDRIRFAWEGEHHAVLHGSQGSPRFGLGMFTSPWIGWLLALGARLLGVACTMLVPEALAY